jgi:MFS family permease
MTAIYVRTVEPRDLNCTTDEHINSRDMMDAFRVSNDACTVIDLGGRDGAYAITRASPTATQQQGNAAIDARDNTSSRAGWYAVTLLAVLYSVSLVDRQILALLVAPIAHDIGTSDVEMGLLMGPAFALLYALIGLPLGHFLDRSHRIRLVFFGVTLWSFSTIAAGFAHDYTSLLVLRAGVAAGEAVLSPAAISLIGDMFRPDKRAMPTAVYTMVSASMSAAALAVGSAALAAARHIELLGLAPWRLTLILVGLPGLILAALLLGTVVEPRRLGNENKPPRHAGLKDFGLYLRANISGYGALFLCYASAVVINTGMLSWIPSLLTRQFGLAITASGYIFGAIGAIAGIFGAIIALSIVFWARNHNGARTAFNTMLAGMCVSTVAVSILPLAGSVYAVEISLVAFILGTSCFSIMFNVAVQSIAPAHFRARLISLALFSSTMGGVTVGPVLIPLLAGSVFHGASALAHALGITAMIFGPISIICIAASRYVFLQSRVADPGI